MVGQVWVIVSVTALVMLSPGPDMVLVLRNTVVGGRRAGLQTSTGILSGNLVHITYCLLGIGVVISRSIVAFSALKYAAAAYLIYLGMASFRPKGGTLALFYLGVFTVVITPETSAGVMLLLIASMMLVSASFWLCFVYTLDRPTVRQWIERSQQTVHRIFGGLLILLGLRVASMRR